MRRLVAWIGGIVGGIAAYRFVRRQEASLQASPEAAPQEPDGRADELRAKLAESRAAEPAADEVPPPESESPEERRLRVHEEGRAAVDEMRSE
jgi:hypothetical protein